MIEVEIRTKRLIKKSDLDYYLEDLVELANYPEEIRTKLPKDKFYKWESKDINSSHVFTEIIIKD
jgi:hypothetical protein